VPVLGITGGVHTGKSTFTRALLRRLPADVFDADRCAHELLETDAATRESVSAAFGSEVFDSDGRPDRGKLRELVFANELHRRRLEEILHPAIRARWASLADVSAKTGAWLLVDIPLLFETNAEPQFDRVIVVACSPETQIRRLRENRGFDDQTSGRVIAAQMDLGTKIKKADHVIWNDSTDRCLDGQAALLSGWLKQRYGRDNDNRP
jgi:dephospho-CoA kinase